MELFLNGLQWLSVQQRRQQNYDNEDDDDDSNATDDECNNDVSFASIVR